MKTEPKFYQNLKDDNHCLQASIMMVLNTLNINVSWDEVNEMTDYENNLYSWTPRTTVALAERIPGTKLVSGMDYRQFAARGEQYFKECNKNNPKWFELQKKHASANFKKEQIAAKEIVDNDLIEKCNLQKGDIEKLLSDNLLIALVDAGKLAEQNRSSGHFVVVYAQDDNNFILHDPGLPSHEAWTIDKEKFMKAFQNEIIIVPKGDK